MQYGMFHIGFQKHGTTSGYIFVSATFIKPLRFTGTHINKYYPERDFSLSNPPYESHLTTTERERGRRGEREGESVRTS